MLRVAASTMFPLRERTGNRIFCTPHPRNAKIIAQKPLGGDPALIGNQIADDVTAQSANAARLAAAPARSGGDAIREAAEGKRLQDHVTGSGQCREEETFTTEEGVLETAHVLNVVVDSVTQEDEAAGNDAHLPPRLEADPQHVPAGVEKNEAVAGQLLQDEAFPAEQSRAESLRECDGEIDVADAAEECVALGENGVAA